MKLIAALTVSVSTLVAQTELVAQAERPAARSVTAVRHWSLTDVTRVAIEVSGDFDFVTERLHNPERVYFDIPNSRPRIESRRIFTEQVDDKRLQRIRVAETLPSVTRVVLDLAGTVEASTSQLSNPNRLIIELRAGVGLVIPTERPPAIGPSPVPPVIPPVALKPEPPKPVRPRTEPAISDAPRVELPRPPKIERSKLEPMLAATLPPRQPVKTDAPLEAPAESPTTPPASPSSPASEIGKAARHTSSGQTSLVRALGLKVGRVVIDPGHGGHDQGTQGAKGLTEKELVLDVARRVGKLIEDRMNAEVVYTRTDDTFVPLEGRTALANDKKADLFLSIHANSSPIPRIAGVETYYLNFTESKDALDVASRENASSQKSIFELRDIIQKITLHDKAEESKEFAGRLQTALYGFSGRNVPNSKNRGVKKAPFVVLIGANMPSVLAEIGFLSNAREEALLKKPDYRQKLAEALFRGISRYAESLSHFQQVARAQN